MSIMVWKVLRRLPKPALLLVLFFLLAAVARAEAARMAVFHGGFNRLGAPARIPVVTRSYTPFW